MADSNGLPPKEYKKMLSSIYLQTCKDAKTIKDNFTKNRNPICQKENRYFSPRTKGNILTQEYIKKMADKPERPHIRRIPISSNLSNSLTVLGDYKKLPCIKFHPKLRKNQSSLSAPHFENNQKQFTQSSSYKNLYLDNFNSIKEIQFFRNTNKGVSIKYLIIKILNELLLQKKFFKHNSDNFVIGTAENKPLIMEDLHGFKRPVENTKLDIFPNAIEENPKLEIKVKRNEKLKKKNLIIGKHTVDNVGGIISPKSSNSVTKKMPSKPCNNDYNIVTNEAKKNANVRYYFENNLSNFNIN